MKQSAYRKLHQAITEEITELIHTAGMDTDGRSTNHLADIQPTTRLSHLAAQAAANVLIGFERGRELGWDERKIYVSQKG